MSTLPIQQPIDGTVPVVSAGGGNPASYRDPKSPESIMLKAKRAQVQAEVDTKFDTNQPTHEPFRDSSDQPYLLALIAAGLLGILAIKLRRRR
jgi:hypothetical protein